MKNTKITKILSGLTFLFFLGISCSEDIETLVEEEGINTSTALKSRSDTTIIVDAVYNASDSFNDPTLYNGVDQATVDKFIKTHNLNQLSTGSKIDVKTVNQIISEIGKVYETGPSKYIENSTYSKLAKEILLIQINGKSVPDLTKRIGFNKLSSSEQNMLISNNGLLQEFEKRSKIQGETKVNCSSTDDPGGCIIGTWVGSTIGNVVGNSACGPVCGAIGGAIGGIIGGAIGGKE